MADPQKRLHQLLKVLDLSPLQIGPKAMSSNQQTQKIFESNITSGRLKTEEAHRIQRIVALANNSSLMTYLEESCSLPVFRAELYFRPRPGHELALDFIQCFANGPCVAADKKDVVKDSELQAIAHRFTTAARDTVILIYFRIASVLSSLCAFMRQNVSFQDFVDVLNRFLSPLWALNCAQKPFTGFISESRLVQGWSLVNECLKVLCQELTLFEVDNTQTSEAKVSDRDDKDDITCVTEEMVIKMLPDWYNKIVVEFFFWVYTILEGRVSLDDFINTAKMVATPLISKLLKDMSCKEQKKFDVDALRSHIKAAAAGEPTMAEILYDPLTMNPTLKTEQLNRTVLWNKACVLKRCRNHYSSVIRKSENAYFIKPLLHPSLPVTADGQHRPSKKHCRDKEFSDREVAMGPACRENNESDSQSCATKRARHSSPEKTKNAVLRSLVHHSLDVQETLPATSTAASPTASSIAHTTMPNNEEDFAVATLQGEPTETFLTVLTSWNPGPQSGVDKDETEHLAYGNDVWLRGWSRAFKNVIKNDVTSCKSMIEYGNHWKPLVMMELRGSVASAIRNCFPSARNKSPNLLDDFRDEMKHFRIDVVKVSHTRALTHLKCNSNDAQFTRAVAKELQGGMICIGYIQKNNSELKVKQPDLSIIACRTVNWDEEQYAFGSTNRRADDVLDVIEMSLTISRKRFKSTDIVVGDRVILAKLTTYSPYVRTFKALYDTESLPSSIRRILCDIESTEREDEEEDKFITPISNHEKNLRNLESRINPGCRDYLDAMRRMGKIDESQHIAISSAIASMADCNPGTSNISLVKGPPGTGKTDCITFLVGALMHHTQYGHVFIPGHEPVDRLRRFVGTDSILRHSSNQTSFSFLITASSNNAVDNAMLRIKNCGIMGKDGSILHPEMCRVARQNYEFAELNKFSINSRALPFDRYIHHPAQNRKTASTKALGSYKKECILYFATLSTVGGPQWKNLKILVDVAITDEGAYPFEPEAILPFIATRRHSPNRRMLAVVVGDNNQLVEPALGLQLIREHKLTLPFNYEYQMRSLFDRLIARKRVTCSMLLVQYRMHPSIASIHFRYFYDGLIQSGLPSHEFEDVYNRGPVSNGYAPFTCIDTSRCAERFETKRDAGRYYNDVEIDVIDSALWKLYRLVGNDVSRLDGRIALLIPYRSQVEHVRSVLMEPKKFVRFATQKARSFGRDFKITVDTSDGMQGSERDIVIFAATRSNEEQEIGFLSDRRRLNVAMSRMRKLMIFIGDFSTLTKTQARYFTYIDRISLEGRCGASRREWCREAL